MAITHQPHHQGHHAGHILPLSAIVGQDTMVLALKLLAVCPRIGGLLLEGEKGTAKSTVVRAAMHVCLDGPMKTLPLNATEDRLLGGIDLDVALGTGQLRSRAGLLAEAHGGVLYVDEINLLADHLVDVILDVAERGMVHVQREGITRSDPASFILIGSMNPEEGSLRPQFVDRFGLSLQVRHLTDIDQRVQVMSTQLAADRDPAGVTAAYALADEQIRTQVATARRQLDQVRIPSSIHRLIVAICANANVAGHRADITMMVAAKAYTALAGRWRVTDEDVMAVAELVLTHRRRDGTAKGQSYANSPFDNQDGGAHREAPDDGNAPAQPNSQDPHADQGEGSDPTRDGPTDATQTDATTPHPEANGQRDKADSPPGSAPAMRSDDGELVREEGSRMDLQGDGHGNPASGEGKDDSPSEIGDIVPVRPLTLPPDRIARAASGRRYRSRTRSAHGRIRRALPTAHPRDINLAATLRAALPRQFQRKASISTNIQHPVVDVQPEDWRRVERVGKAGACVLFVVDASGSMGAQGRMVATKGAVMSLLLDAYARRDHVGVIAFRRDQAEVLLPFTHAIERATRELAGIPTGGRTPLAAALVKATEVVMAAMAKDPTLRPLVIVVTDGRANCGLNGQTGQGVRQEALRVAHSVAQHPAITWVVVDTTQTGSVQAGRARELADALGGVWYTFATLNRDDLLTVTSKQLPPVQP